MKTQQVITLTEEQSKKLTDALVDYVCDISARSIVDGTANDAELEAMSSIASTLISGLSSRDELVR